MKSRDDCGHKIVSNIMTINLNVFNTIMKGIIDDKDDGLTITMYRH